MPSLDLDENNSQYQIRAYRPGMIQVNEKKLTQSLIIMPNQLIENWGPQTIDQILPDSFIPILTLRPTILLIGTGEQQIFLNPALYSELINQGIGVEIMTTRAACRTFNALSAENRNVAAALILG